MVCLFLKRSKKKKNICENPPLFFWQKQSAFSKVRPFTRSLFSASEQASRRVDRFWSAGPSSLRSFSSAIGGGVSPLSGVLARHPCAAILVECVALRLFSRVFHVALFHPSSSGSITTRGWSSWAMPSWSSSPGEGGGGGKGPTATPDRRKR